MNDYEGFKENYEMAVEQAKEIASVKDGATVHTEPYIVTVEASSGAVTHAWLVTDTIVFCESSVERAHRAHRAWLVTDEHNRHVEAMQEKNLTLGEERFHLFMATAIYNRAAKHQDPQLRAYFMRNALIE